MQQTGLQRRIGGMDRWVCSLEFTPALICSGLRALYKPS